MGNTMLITVKGRKTGRKITLPVSYYRDGTNLWVISSRDRTWWRNLQQGAGVDLHLNGQDVQGYGEVISDERTVALRLAEYVRYLPGSARQIGLRVENEIPNSEDLVRVAHERLFIRICVN